MKPASHQWKFIRKSKLKLPNDNHKYINRSFLRYIILFIVVTFLLFNLSFSQNVGKIAGTVLEAKSGEPLPGVNIIIVDMYMGAASDENGDYYILNVPPGRYELQAIMVGYETTKVTDVIVNSGKTTVINFELQDELLEIEEVVVVATRPDVERDKTSTSAILRFDEVETLPGVRDIGDVIGLAADVYDGHFRGGREGEEYYILQGMGIVNPLDRSSAFMPIMSGVEEVEVITSGFGAQYGNAQSGVVNISMKEGDRTHWKSRMETRTRLPGKKHFGPSVYDPAANDYLRLLQDENIWLTGDPSGEQIQAYYVSMLDGASESFKSDTLVQLAVAQALWEQTKRDIGRTYGNDMDYSLEMATGGPINNKMRMFLALRYDKEYPVFPTEQPDIEYQAMGNIVTDLSEKSTFRLSGGYTYHTENDFPSENSASGYRRWLWDRIVGIQERKRTNIQIGARYTHTISQSTFYEIKLNSLFTNNEIGGTPIASILPDSFATDPAGGTFGYPNTKSPDRLYFQYGNDDFTNEETRTISLDGSFTSQVTKAHLINTGVQINSYYIDVSNFDNVRSITREKEYYTANPFEAAAYLQDKMEFEGMIANVGLRFDLWYSGVDYYTDIYKPFGDPDTNGIYHPSNAERKESPIYGRLQPRLGFSFPISVNTTFHLNYGSFMQRPSFKYIVSRRINQRIKNAIILGNPRLKPETTNSYDVGVVQALGEGFTIDVSGYYKDVKNLIQEAEFFNQQSGEQVSSYFNLDYADIRGFRIQLNKRKGNLTGSINYQFGYATGKSATTDAYKPIFTRLNTGEINTNLDNVPTRDIVLDFDRTHNLVITLGYRTKMDWGPSIFNTTPFANLYASVNSRIQSGRPYTSPFETWRINAKRSPTDYNTDFRITKKIRSFMGIPVSIYGEVFNVFNNKHLNFDYIFRNPEPSKPNRQLEYYELYPVNDKDNGIRYWYNKDAQGDLFSVDQSFLIYENQPRSYNFGIVFEF